DPKQRLVRRHPFPRTPFLCAALLHRAVPGIALGDPGLAVAILEQARPVTRRKARGQTLRIDGDHRRDDTAGPPGVKSRRRYVSVTSTTPIGCECAGHGTAYALSRLAHALLGTRR